MPPPPPPAAAPRKPVANDGVKETFESIIIAFILAFTFRAYVVEAFVIPTGSMAPTLLGQHLRVACEQCGYRFETDVPEDSVRKDPRTNQRIATIPLINAARVVCPMCHFHNLLPRGTRPRAGDRILVHKFLYSFTEPNRYDVVVFKNPDNPADNYIKRLVGLPDETLLIVEGDVYVKPRGADDSHWRIARKTDVEENPHALKVQRAMWQPVYHSDYLPLDGGRPSTERGWQAAWSSPWRASAGRWLIENRRGYRHGSAERGVIAFDFTRQKAGRDWYAYNQFHGQAEQPIEDVRLAASVRPDEPGLSLRLRTTARLDQTDVDARLIAVEARIGPDGSIGLYKQAGDDWEQLAAGTVRPLAVGRYTDLELWLVDHEVSLWVAGRRELVWQYSLPWATVMGRRPLALGDFPALEIETEGSPVTLARVEVDRDVAYTSDNPGNGHHRQGTMVKEGAYVDAAPIELLPEQYFCLGDNSPLSHDGRFWNSANPWVSKTMLPDRNHRFGVVPARLMIGRAFFVYFPAPYPMTDNRVGLIPNFGSMRFIR